jgi:hypothetical protein
MRLIRNACVPTVLVLFLAAFASAQTTLLSEARLAPAGGQLGDRVGWSVAVSGDRAFVCAPDVGTHGVVYVYVRSGSGWTQETTLTPSAPTAGTRFARSVAASGDTVVVGAPANYGAGQAYVFVRAGPVWLEQAAWSGGSRDFGWATSISGDTVLVGEPNGAHIGIQVYGPGTAHVFTRQGSVWIPEAELPDPAPAKWGDYGATLAISGDTVMIAETTEKTGIVIQGEVEVFTRVGSTWSYTTELTLPGFSNPPGFGWQLALDGDTAVIGAGGFNSYGFISGNAYVYDNINGVWTLGVTLRPSAAGPNDAFPSALALSGDSIVAGTNHVNGTGLPGRAHWFSREAGVWTESAKLLPTSGIDNNDFGRAVAIDADAVVVGSPWESDGGAAFAFRLCSKISNYCSAGMSASGCQATLAANGTPSASAASGFTVEAVGVEGDRDGLYFFGANGRQAAAWGNGTSYQCVVPPVKRAGVLAGTGTQGACDGSFAQDLNARWTAKPAQNPGAGAVVQAQLWYRDPQNTSNRTTSLSDALEFCVEP